MDRTWSLWAVLSNTVCTKIHIMWGSDGRGIESMSLKQLGDGVLCLKKAVHEEDVWRNGRTDPRILVLCMGKRLF